METPIDDLRAAGFNDQEIGEWASGRRAELSSAGFSDKEIEAYFVGGPVVSDEIPDAMVRRLRGGDEARGREGGLAQTIPQFAGLLGTPDGRTKLWDAVKQYPSQFMSGMADLFKLPGEVNKGTIDLNTEQGMDQAVGLGMLVGLGRFNKVGVTGKTSGLSVQMGDQMSRISRGPAGEVVDIPVGTLPKSEDFVASARSIGEDASAATQDKLLKLYRERGAHPSEVAFDAANDPVTAQRILSSEPRDLPEQYGPPAPPVKETAPLSEPPPYTTEMLYSADPEGPLFRSNQEGHRFLVGREGTADLTTLPPVADVAADTPVRLRRSDIDHLDNNLHRADAKEAGFRDGLHLALDALDNWTEIREAHRGRIDLVRPLEDGQSVALVELAKAQSGDYWRVITAGVRSERQLGEVLHVRERTPETASGQQSPSRSLPARAGEGESFAQGVENATIAEGGKGGKGGGPPTEPPSPPAPGSFEAAQAKVLEKVSVGDRGKRSFSIDKLYTEMIDDLHPIKGVSEDAYQLARLTRGTAGRVEHFLEHGTFDFDTLKTTGKSFREIVEPVQADLEGFRAYLTARRAVEIEATGRQSGIDSAAARQVLEQGAARFAKAADDLVAYQNSLLEYLRKSGVLSDRAYNAMVEANKAYVPFYRVMGDEAGGPGTGKGLGPGNPVKKLKGSDRGIVDPLESIIKNTYAYISIAERNSAGLKLVEALQEQGLKAETTAPKRSAAETELIDYLRQNGVPNGEAIVDFVRSASPDDGTAISAWRDGKRVSVEVNDPDLVRAFRGLDAQTTGLLTRIFAVPSRALRAGAVLTPDFMARNIIRDFQTAFVNSTKGIFSPIDTAKGLVSVVRKDADFLAWMKSGGANATLVALDRRYMQESLSTLTKETGLGSRAWNVVTNPLAPLRMLSELAENTTRVAEFKKDRAGAASKAAMQDAAFASREVTLDFARMGARMRAYNMVTAFANAQIQGMDRIGRAFVDRPANTILKIAGGVTLPSVLLWWANRGDPRYEELPDWQKDLFWIVLTDNWQPVSAADAAGKPDHLLRQVDGQWQVNKGHIWRIPKPFELGVVFGSGAERVLSAIFGKDKEAFDGFSKSVMSVLTPNYLPTAVQPVFEQWANRSTFTDRTLVPADVEKLLSEYQYTPYTTELSKALGRIVAAFPGFREASVEPGHPAGPVARTLSNPILVENYVRSWTGGLGVYAMNAADAALRKAGVLPDPITPTPTLADIPFIKAFAVRYPSASSESIQKFYDDFERNKRYFDTWMAKAKEGDAEAVERIGKAGGDQIFMQLDDVKSALSEHSKLVRDVYKNPIMPADEKRQLIDGLYYNMMRMAQLGRSLMVAVREHLEGKAQGAEQQ